MLANAIGGSGAIKAAVVGGRHAPERRSAPHRCNGVSLQPITDMQATIEAIAGAQNAPNLADRRAWRRASWPRRRCRRPPSTKTPGLARLRRSGPHRRRSRRCRSRCSRSTRPSSITAYGLNGDEREQLQRADGGGRAHGALGRRTSSSRRTVGWDTHGDSNGNNVRNMMTQRIAPGLQHVPHAHGRRRHRGAQRHRRHLRRLPPQPSRLGSPGEPRGARHRQDAQERDDRQDGQPRRSRRRTPRAIPGLWQLLSAASKVDTTPFGANPHAVLA